MEEMHNIQKNHTNVNLGGYLENVKFLVIHFVGAAGQAKDNAKYFKNVNRNASAHYFVDPENIVEVVPENRVAWHVGDGHSSGQGEFNGYVKSGLCTNYNSIGIEMCQDTSTGNNAFEWEIHPRTYKQVLLLAKHIMQKYNITIDRVIRHYDVSGKNCPGVWRKNNWKQWWQFKDDLKKMLGNQEASNIVKEQKPKTINNSNANDTVIRKTSGKEKTNKSFRFKKSSPVYNQPSFEEKNVATYYPNEIVNLDYLYYGKSYLWGSYMSYGKRRFVILAKVVNGMYEYFGEFR